MRSVQKCEFIGVADNGEGDEEGVVVIMVRWGYAAIEGANDTNDCGGLFLVSLSLSLDCRVLRLIAMLSLMVGVMILK